MVAPAAAWRAPAGLLRRPFVGVVLVLVAVGGLGLRVWVYRSALGVPDSDEAVVGLMARHVLHGQVTTFFWGQAYGGSQEALLTAPLFALFGSGWLLLRVVPIVLSAVASLVVWQVGRIAVGARGANVAAVALWIWPPYLVYYLTHQWGFYSSGLVYCGLLLLLALQVAEQPTALRCSLLGLVIGLAVWEDIQLAPIIVPVVAWTVWQGRRALARLSAAVPFAVLGATPWLLWNTRHGWRSLSSPLGGDTTTYQHRLRVFASPLLPMLLGLRASYTQRPLLATAFADGVYLLLIAAAGYGAYVTRHRNVSLLYVVLAAFPFVYALSPQTLAEQVPRYLLVLSPVLVLLLAQLATSRIRAFGVVAAIAAVSLINLQRMDTWWRTVPPNPPIAPRNLQPLIATLDRLQVDHVYATYWLAYRLDFETHERIVAAENRLTDIHITGQTAVANPNPQTDPPSRYPTYTKQVSSDPRHGFVFFNREPGDIRRAQRAKVMKFLLAHGYTAHPVSIFTIYTKRR